MSFSVTTYPLYLLPPSLGARFMGIIATSLRSKPGVTSMHVCSSWSWSCINSPSFSLVGCVSLQSPRIIIRKIKPVTFIKFSSNLWTMVKFNKFWKNFPGYYSFYKIPFSVLGIGSAHHIHVPEIKLALYSFLSLFSTKLHTVFCWRSDSEGVLSLWQAV